MKKGIALYLSAALLAALLSGCGQPTATEETSSAASAPESVAEETTPTPEPATPAPTEEPVEEPAEEMEEEYVPGERTDTDYTNTTLGLYFALPETMVMASDDEINQLMQVTAEMMYEDPATGEKIIDYSQLTTVYEMMAIDVATGSNVIVMSEKLPLAAITVEQYISAMENQLKQTTVEVDFGEPESYTLGSTEFTRLNYSVTSNGTEMNQTMLLKKVGSRMYAIAISYPSTVDVSTLLDCFSPVSETV